MDIESFRRAFELRAPALSMLKSVKDVLPDSPQKEVAAQKISEAEKAFEIAEAKAAQELGYPLCKCTWPPQIMLATQKKFRFKCPKCDSEIDTSTASVSARPGTRSRLMDTLDRY
jgi:transcription initiation factor IIE alpha subunit